MRPRILIIDDTDFIREALSEFLNDSGKYHIRTAGSAESALEILKDESADVCIVDMRLPGMSGVEFMLQAHESTLCSSFLPHTGSMSVDLPPDLLDSGITLGPIMLKPCSYFVLRDAIEALLASPDNS